MANFAQSNLFEPLRFDFTSGLKLLQEQDKIALAQARTLLDERQREFDREAELATRDARIQKMVSEAALNDMQAKTLEQRLPFVGEQTRLGLELMQREITAMDIANTREMKFGFTDRVLQQRTAGLANERAELTNDLLREYGPAETEAKIRRDEAEAAYREAMAGVASMGREVLPWLEQGLKGVLSGLNPDDPAGTSERLSRALSDGSNLNKLLGRHGDKVWGQFKSILSAIVRGTQDMEGAVGNIGIDLQAVMDGSGINQVQTPESISASARRLNARMSEHTATAQQVSSMDILGIYSTDRNYAKEAADNAILRLGRVIAESQAALATGSPAVRSKSEIALENARQALSSIGEQMEQVVLSEQALAGDAVSTPTLMTSLRSTLPGLFRNALEGGGESLFEVDRILNTIEAYPQFSYSGGENEKPPIVSSFEPYVISSKNPTMRVKAGFMFDRIMNSRLTNASKNNIRDELSAHGMLSTLEDYSKAFALSPFRGEITALEAAGAERDEAENKRLDDLYREIAASAEAFSSAKDETPFLDAAKIEAASNPDIDLPGDMTDRQAFEWTVSSWYKDHEFEAPSESAQDLLYFHTLTTPRSEGEGMKEHVGRVLSLLNNEGWIGPNYQGGDRKVVTGHPARELRKVVPGVEFDTAKEYFWFNVERDILGPMNQKFQEENRFTNPNLLKYSRDDVIVEERVIYRRPGDTRPPSTGYIFKVRPEAMSADTGDDQVLNQRGENGVPIPWVLPTDLDSLNAAAEYKVEFPNMFRKNEDGSRPPSGYYEKPKWSKKLKHDLGNLNPDNRAESLRRLNEAELMQPIYGLQRELWLRNLFPEHHGSMDAPDMRDKFFTSGLDMVGRVLKKNAKDEEEEK